MISSAAPDHRRRPARRASALSVAVASLLPVFAATGHAAASQASSGDASSARRFSTEVVAELARRLAAEPPSLPSLNADSTLAKLTYDQYRDIRVNEESATWRHEQVPFRVDLLPAGFLFRTPVEVSIVESGVARVVTRDPDDWILGPSVEKALAGRTLPVSGFRVRTRINSRNFWDEFLVFQGASYFRAVDRGGTYGLSARGLALRTAEPEGEEFPVFTHFWIERPSASAVGIVIHALLESKSTTGACRFSVVPGRETLMDVDLTLYPRVPLDAVGLAPLTSMFLFDESDRARVDDFRDEVHDSDGLQIVLASGEQVWRQLTNPAQLQISSFTTAAPQGFGLVQRSRHATNFQDLEAHYERRPSAWIVPQGEWGAGAVELIEIPSDRETNDNIVALWRPRATIPAGQPWHRAYQIRWTREPHVKPSLERVLSTRIGPSFDGKRLLFVVDFTGAGHGAGEVRAAAETTAGQLSHIVVQPNPLTKGVRVSFELDPRDADLAELRLRLLRGDAPATETWLYRWTST
jgi:periplasmic glucans biosynthesis protein